MLDLASIKARCEKATLGEWICDERVGMVAVYSGEQQNCIAEAEGQPGTVLVRRGKWVKETETEAGHWEVQEQDLQNSRFIAHARQDIPALVAEVERLRGEYERGVRESAKMADRLLCSCAEDDCEVCEAQGNIIHAINTLLPPTTQKEKENPND